MDDDYAQYKALLDDEKTFNKKKKKKSIAQPLIKGRKPKGGKSPPRPKKPKTSKGKKVILRISLDDVIKQLPRKILNISPAKKAKKKPQKQHGKTRSGKKYRK